MSPGLLMIGLVMAAVLAAIYRRDRAAAYRIRAAALSRLPEVVEVRELELQRDGFPVLRGTYHGHEVTLRATAEGLAARKLPSLWLEATVLAPIPHEGVLDYLVRPGGTEIFSPSRDLEHRLEIPDDWPGHAAMLRTDRPDAHPPLGLLARHLKICEDPRVKELVIAPRGIRFVYQADEAVRSHYLLLRQAHFEGGPVSPALVTTLLDAAIDLAADLNGEAAAAVPAPAPAAEPDPRPAPRPVPEPSPVPAHASA